MHQDLLADLTAVQREAVTHVDGPLLVLAGPGSGKTRVITRRIAYLIREGVAAHHILAITFTNKAAAEMKERVLALNAPRGATVCTFHALAARLLRAYADAAGLSPNFSIYDDADQKAAMRETLRRLEMDAQNFPPARMLYRVSAHKNDLVTPQELAGRASGYLDKTVARVYAAYQETLAANAAVDFDDLLVKLAFLLRDEPDIRRQLSERFRYVLVDEYQDTNHAQYQIARGLALAHHNLGVTGDPDQSIYAWRGADIGNILAFEQDYPDAHVVRLEENFRSTPEVLAVADQLIRQNTQRKHKRLFTSLASGVAPTLQQYQDEHDEGEGLARWLQEMRRAGYEYRDMAVFYRVNAMSRVLEDRLRRSAVPYQIVRGVEFFQRAEIKDMVAYLRLLVNPSDQVSLRRVINRPTRGIGATTVARLFAFAEQRGIEVGQALRDAEAIDSLNAAAQTRLKQFQALLDSLRAQAAGPVEFVVRAVYEQSGLRAALAAEKTDEPGENVNELISSAAQYDAQTEAPSLVEYLQQIALVSDSDAYDAEAGAVSLMTLHAAKGLEFPVVAIVGVEDGLLPHRNSMDSDKSLEEERRLLFVGITRARERLALSYARNRTFQGMSMAAVRSQFLRGLEGLECVGGLLSGSAARGWPEQDEADEPAYEPEDQRPEHYPGQLVRHPTFGLGRIQQLIPNRADSKVIVQFNTGARKTLFLKYAKLETLD